MESDGNTRIPLLCKYCVKLQEVLSVHLRRVCRKNADEAEIKVLVEEARATMRELVRNLSLVQYRDLDDTTSSSTPQDFFAKFLEARKSTIYKRSERQLSQVPEEEAEGYPANEDDEFNHQRNTRIPLVCKFCLRLHDSFSVHLRRACLKNGDEAMFKEVVKEARSKMRHLVKNLSVVAYEDLDPEGAITPRHYFISFLEARGSLIINKATETPYCEDDEEDLRTSEEEEEEVAEDQPSTSTESATALTLKPGLFKKHSLYSPVIVGFRKYLEISYSKSILRMQVNSIAQFLHYMDPERASATFIHHPEQTVEFFRQLDLFTTSKRAAFSYIYSIENFVKYTISEARYLEEDPSLQPDSKKYLDVLKNIRVTIRKRKS